MDRKIFFDTIRPTINLTTQNVFGFGKVLDYAEQAKVDILELPYILATAFWETAQTMEPIREYGGENYLRKKKYYPFVGMGLIQVTWDYNYKKAAKLLGLPENYFINSPKKLLEWQYALPLLFLGMDTGLYTGKKLDDYIDDIDETDDEDLREFINARRIVNGTDKATAIGRLALTFEKALKASSYGKEEKPSTPITVPIQPTADPEPPAEEKHWFIKLLEAIYGYLRNPT